MGLVIGIVGSRRRDSDEDFRTVLGAFTVQVEQYRIQYPVRKGEGFYYGISIVSGGCPKGRDRFAEIIARSKGITITIHHADCNGSEGKRAGFIRNTQIAEDCDILLALVSEDRTGGTEDTVAKAERLGKRVILL
jgi:hypothetical protein